MRLVAVCERSQCDEIVELFKFPVIFKVVVFEIQKEKNRYYVKGLQIVVM